MKIATYLKRLLEYLGGERDESPQGTAPIVESPLVRSLTWILFLLLIYMFSGQSSKFIYIDF